MSLLDRLYMGEEIPNGTDHSRVKQMEQVLRDRLTKKLQQRYTWLATCTVAVQAGEWGGRRRVAQRQKLMSLINKCRKYRGIETIVPDNGWAYIGLRFGYGACHSVDEAVSSWWQCAAKKIAKKETA